ncbi:hypothetical protein ACTXN4_25525, partial [Pseudomonas helleri]|uniref:hypothetical protein n=1 Tax=Pseudomonas helleri TaxID=1608996 RepID=UPI003FD58CF5
MRRPHGCGHYSPRRTAPGAVLFCGPTPKIKRSQPSAAPTGRADGRTVALVADAALSRSKQATDNR